MKKILIFSNSSWNIYNFRLNLIKELISKKFDISIICPDNIYFNKLNSYNLNLTKIKLDNKGINLFKDLIFFVSLYKKIKNEKPDLILSYTVKPNIYGSLIARILKIKIINNVTGLGTAFINNSFLKIFAIIIYKISFIKSNLVFFHNLQDLNYFVKLGIVKLNNAKTLPGSGVDVSYYNYNLLIKKKHIEFLYIGRILIDKGFKELINAITILKEQYPNIILNVVGPLQSENRSSIPKDLINKWLNSNIFNYLGFFDDIREKIISSDCVVLPSYKEGMPRSILEAAAIGRAIVTTDIPGCNAIVDDGVNGYLCKPKDIKSLRIALEKFIILSYEEKKIMGIKSREKALKYFDESKVISISLKEIQSLIK